MPIKCSIKNASTAQMYEIDVENNFIVETLINKLKCQHNIKEDIVLYSDGKKIDRAMNINMFHQNSSEILSDITMIYVEKKFVTFDIVTNSVERKVVNVSTNMTTTNELLSFLVANKTIPSTNFDVYHSSNKLSGHFDNNIWESNVMLVVNDNIV